MIIFRHVSLIIFIHIKLIDIKTKLIKLNKINSFSFR